MFNISKFHFQNLHINKNCYLYIIRISIKLVLGVLRLGENQGWGRKGIETTEKGAGHTAFGTYTKQAGRGKEQKQGTKQIRIAYTGYRVCGRKNSRQGEERKRMNGGNEDKPSRFTIFAFLEIL